MEVAITSEIALLFPECSPRVVGTCEEEELNCFISEGSRLAEGARLALFSPKIGSASERFTATFGQVAGSRMPCSRLAKYSHEIASWSAGKLADKLSEQKCATVEN